MTAATVDDPPAAAPAASRQLLRDSGYVLLGFPLALASFVVLLVGLALGVGLSPGSTWPTGSSSSPWPSSPSW
ncbi:hypothetical protein [Micromonospora sp. NPDC048830]|uniref:hypothetical protein n=1 Tax=Micromonospora sp. NPDC048830 TaxID=3364257 RepID=UPI0037238617